MAFTTLAISEEFVSTLEVLEDGTVNYSPSVARVFSFENSDGTIHILPSRQDDGNDYWADRS